MVDIDINDNRLITFISQSTYQDFHTIYLNIPKKQKQLINDLAHIAPLLLDWVSLAESEELLPYRQIHINKYDRKRHRSKYICGLSKMGAQISRLCCDKARQRYMGQWLDHKALIMHGKKYVKFVRLSAGAKIYFSTGV